MNRLVFIHGRAQGGRSSDEIEREWTRGLEAGFQAIGSQAPTADNVEAPFYGSKLDELTNQADFSLFEVIFRGTETKTPDDDDTPEIDEWDVEFMREVLNNAGVSNDVIRTYMETTVTPRAPWNWEWVQAIGRAVDDRAPAVANLTMWQMTRDVRTYLSRRKVRRAVHDIVGPPLEGERCVVVAHSLGSVVAYWLLTEMGSDSSVPLLVTAGSPLGGESVKRRLPSPLGMPAGVEAWLNVSDPRDPVAIHGELGGSTFPADIDNFSDIDNKAHGPHSIVGYLSDPRVATRIAQALTA